MKHLLITLFALALILTAGSCGRGKQATTAVPADTIPTDTANADGAATDSTLYGKADEFGMSTFTLITDAGDTLYLTRTANDGTDGEIHGDLVEGNRYALTTRDGGEAIGVIINLTELDRHLKGYDIRNGQLFVNGKPVRISVLNDQELKLE